MWSNEKRVIPEPELVPILDGRVWSLRINFWGAGSSIELEMKDLPLNGYGSYLFHDYLILSTRKALSYIKENGLRLDSDQSTVAGVAMVVFKRLNPEKPRARSLFCQHVPHNRQNHGEACAYCGETEWANSDNCPGFLQAMGFQLSTTRANACIKGARTVWYRLTGALQCLSSRRAQH